MKDLARKKKINIYEFYEIFDVVAIGSSCWYELRPLDIATYFG